MLLLRENRVPLDLGDRLRGAHAVTPDLISEVIRGVCRRFPSNGKTERTAQIERLIGAEAWADAALALINLEVPLWKVRRLVYDEGEWHCALSRERELPDWLDQSIESHHTDLSLAILCAFVDAIQNTSLASKTSVPAVPLTFGGLYDRICCENFS